MTTLVHEARVTYAFVERNFNLIKRYGAWELVFLVYAIAQALSIGLLGTAMGQISGQPIDTDQLVIYLLAGSLVWSYLSVVLEAIGEMIQWERWEGTIEYTLMAPVSRLSHMVGTALFAVVYGLLRTGVILGVVGLFFRLDLDQANLPAAAVVLLFASVSFIGLGIMVAVLPLLFTERGGQMIKIVQACLLVFSGVYYPVEILPAWMQAVAAFSPATYALSGVRDALLAGHRPSELAGTLLPLLLIGAASIPLGLKIFGAAERHARRTGRLKRSG